MSKFLHFKQTSRMIEFAHFYNRSIEIVESHDPESLKITAAHASVVSGQTLVDELRIKSRKLPFTREQEALLQNLDNAVSVLRRYLSYQVRLNVLEDLDRADLYVFLNLYLHRYWSKNSYQKTGLIEKMFAVLDADTLLLDLLESENLVSMLDKVRSEFEILDAAYKNRRQTIANLKKSRTVHIKRELYFMLRSLHASIEMAELIYTDVSYKELIDELNQEIFRFNAGSKARKRVLMDEAEATVADEFEELAVADNSTDGPVMAIAARMSEAEVAAEGGIDDARAADAEMVDATTLVEVA